MVSSPPFGKPVLTRSKRDGLGGYVKIWDEA